MSHKMSVMFTNFTIIKHWFVIDKLVYVPVAQHVQDMMLIFLSILLQSRQRSFWSYLSRWAANGSIKRNLVSSISFVWLNHKKLYRYFFLNSFIRQPFNKETVRMMIGMFDKQNTGQGISFQDFGALWKYVTDWQNCFR